MEGGKPPRDCKQSLRPYKKISNSLARAKSESPKFSDNSALCILHSALIYALHSALLYFSREAFAQRGKDALFKT